jgi:hypothetical protein
LLAREVADLEVGGVLVAGGVVIVMATNVMLALLTMTGGLFQFASRYVVGLENTERSFLL